MWIDVDACMSASGTWNQHGWRPLSPSIPIAPVMIWRVLKTQERSVKDHWLSRKCTGLGVKDIPLWGAPTYGVSVSSPGILVPWSAASRNSAPCAKDFQSKDIQHVREHTGYEQSNETVVWLCLISGQKWVSCCNLKDQRYLLGNFRNMKYVGAAIYET